MNTGKLFVYQWVGRRWGDKGILAAVKERCWKAVWYRLAEYIITCIELGFVTSLQQLSLSLFWRELV